MLGMRPHAGHQSMKVTGRYVIELVNFVEALDEHSHKHQG